MKRGILAHPLWKIVGTVFLFDLIFYPFLYFFLLPNTGRFIVNLAIMLIRLIACCGIGFWFGARTPLENAADSKKPAIIAAAALIFGAVYFFVPSLSIAFFELVWYGTRTIDWNPFNYPVRLFFSENLTDQITVISYMCLIAVYQMQIMLRSRTQKKYRTA